MSEQAPLRCYFVVGEESGDVLGAELLQKMRDLGGPVDAMGLAGPRMQALGINSLFDISDIAVMGISAVASRLPKLLTRISQTVRDVIAKKPDVLVLIDSPEFAYRVAKRVRAQTPDIRIVKYVAPSVWAWRPGRARKITSYIDHILAILPFEPQVLEELGGPEATYVGHPLAAKIPAIGTAAKRKVADVPVLVALPGSRAGEINRLMPVIGETLAILKERGNRFEVILPAVARHERLVQELARDWAFKPAIVTGDEARRVAFAKGDLALAASGTVTLELALYKVPTISIYKLDGIAMRVRHLLTGWTASLPNLIADYPVVPEKFNEYAHPHYIARMVERLVLDDHERQQQLQGFELIIQRMQQDYPSEELAARTILQIAGRPVNG